MRHRRNLRATARTASAAASHLARAENLYFGYLDYNGALAELAAFDPRKAQVVELRFFGGLSVDETAEVLKVSPETVKRDWRFAKSWLHRFLGGGKDDDTGALSTSCGAGM